MPGEPEAPAPVPAIVMVPPPVVLTALPASRKTPWLPPVLPKKPGAVPVSEIAPPVAVIAALL